MKKIRDKRIAEAAIRCETIPDHQAQVDWMEFALDSSATYNRDM